MAVDRDEILQDCWDNALHSFGTAYIYSNRSVIKGFLLKLNNFLGIIVPLLIGGIVTTYTFSSKILSNIIYLAGIVSIGQLILSFLSINNNWGDSYSYYLESCNDNSQLSNDYKNLAKYPPVKTNEFQSKKEIIDIKSRIRSNSDNKYPLSLKERREAMRYSLRNFQRSCVNCGKVPFDMIATDCGVCGRF
jgi:mobilome CxxCx(11)CxxC protein